MSNNTFLDYIQEAKNMSQASSLTNQPSRKLRNIKNVTLNHCASKIAFSHSMISDISTKGADNTMVTNQELGTRKKSFLQQQQQNSNIAKQILSRNRSIIMSQAMMISNNNKTHHTQKKQESAIVGQKRLKREDETVTPKLPVKIKVPLAAQKQFNNFSKCLVSGTLTGRNAPRTNPASVQLSLNDDNQEFKKVVRKVLKDVNKDTLKNEVNEKINQITQVFNTTRASQNNSRLIHPGLKKTLQIDTDTNNQESSLTLNTIYGQSVEENLPQQNRQIKVYQHNIKLKKDLSNKGNSFMIQLHPVEELSLNSSDDDNLIPLNLQKSLAVRKSDQAAMFIQDQLIPCKFLEDDQVEYVCQYRTDLLMNILNQEKVLVPDYYVKHQNLDKYKRLKIIDWLYAICKKDQVDELNIFYSAVQIMDQFYSVTEGQDGTKIDLVALCCLFINSKLFEIKPFDLKYCVEILGHRKYSYNEILDQESKIIEALQWEMQDYTIYDTYSHLTGLIKAKIQNTKVVSPCLQKIVITEFDERILRDLRDIICIDRFLQLKGSLLISSLIHVRIIKLLDYVSQKKNAKIILDVEFLKEIWDEIVYQDLGIDPEILLKIGSDIQMSLVHLREFMKGTTRVLLK